MSDPRRGFHIRDLMVLVAIVAVFLWLTTVSLYTTNCRATPLSYCKSNSHQIGLALQNYLCAQGRLPNAVTFGEDPAALTSGNPADSVIDKALGNHFLPAGADGMGPMKSWIVDLLPYLDQQELYDEYDFSRPWNDPTPNGVGLPSNAEITNTDIPTLRCPVDLSVDITKGNLSYGCNLGFSRWHFPGGKNPTGWIGQASTGGPGPGPDWGAAVAQQTGVMVLGTSSGNAPWDVRVTTQSFPDGMAQTILIAEAYHDGTLPRTPFSGGVPTNWGTANPNFVGFLASDDVCPGGKCSGLAPVQGSWSQADGPNWTNANRPGSFEAISYGKNFAVPGSFPFANGGHPGLIVVTMADGSTRSISTTIDGTVYAKLITPAGTRLPPLYRQLPLAKGRF